jgi:5-(aminomethyl)-3-furanmethanol phosphate kinase
LTGQMVVKVGGSLFDLPDLGPRLRTWLNESVVHGDETPGPRRIILVAGGGELAETIRRWDRRHPLGAERAHWLAVRAMSLNSHVLAELLPDAEVVQTLPACEDCWNRRRLPVFDPLALLRGEDARPDRLPYSWIVTSDSIAARLAQRAGAEALFLLKSCSVAAGTSLEELADEGIVDEFLPRLAELAQVAGPFPVVSVVNFRANPPEPPRTISTRRATAS